VGENEKGYYFTILGEPKESEDKNTFDTNYRKVYGISPGVLTSHSWFSYDSTMILISRVKEVGVQGEDGALYIPRGALVEAVRGLENYAGISGTYTCNNMGDCNIEGPQIVKVIDGESIPIE
jgi:ABC-type branched-subunit amino acid transport system substrate-binding protein